MGWLTERGTALLTKRGPLLAALLAGCSSLPGLWFPFLSDDWSLIESVSAGPPPATPFDYFRPLYMATLWIDRRVWGLSSPLFHLTNLLLITAAAALVVVLVRRYTGDAWIAGCTGLLFALHPYHVENAAWIAVRGDPLYSVFFMLAALAYDRWRSRARGLPLGAIVLFEAALFAKETAAVLPVLLVLIGLVDRTRRPSPSEWGRGYLPLLVVVAGHFLVLRPLALHGPGRTLAPGFGVGWVNQGLGLTVATILPVDVEILQTRPVLWGSLGGASLLLLLLVARARSDGIPRLALAAAAVFAVLMGPSIVGFQGRYLFLPVAASGLFLASLIGSIRGAGAAAAASLLVSGWLVASVAQWSNWREAALASDRLVSSLVVASGRPGVREIVVANMPFRVRHGSVAGDFRAALALSGGRAVPVRAVSYIAYPSAVADDLAGPPSVCVSRPPPDAVVRLRIPEGPYSHYVAPRPAEGERTVETPVGSVLFDGSGGVALRIPPAPERGRAAYVWIAGRLEALF